MFFGLFGKKEKKALNEECVGEVVHYFPHVKAAVIKLDKGALSSGDHIHVKGHSTDFEQTVTSMQIDHKVVEKVSQKEEVAIQVKKKTRRGDKVFVVKG